MINQDYFKGKSVTVVGLGKSGFACTVLLHNLGARVSVTEKKENKEIMAYARQLPPEIKREFGRHTEDFIRSQDLVVVSPGVDNNCPVFAWAAQQNITVISEIECAWMLCPGRVVAVTGTNGKTTVATLISQVLSLAGKRVFLSGNIGRPFSEDVQQMQSDDFVSLEVSSFQLENIKSFKPEIAIFLNFSADHLDRYHRLPEYLAAKSRIFMNQDKTDYLVLNYDDPAVARLAEKTAARVIYFNHQIHHDANFAALIVVSSLLGISPNICEQVLRDFKGLAHRLEQVAVIKEREFINDSKATNPEATAYALKNMKKPVILIAGGKDKGMDYAAISELVQNKVKALIVFGQAQRIIKSAYDKILPVRQAIDLAQALSFAIQESEPGDAVLLSPMCSSFDMFRNYEHRGEVFKKEVKKLIGVI